MRAQISLETDKGDSNLNSAMLQPQRADEPTSREVWSMHLLDLPTSVYGSSDDYPGVRVVIRDFVRYYMSIFCRKA